MAYVAWPATLPAPETPVSYDRVLPIAQGQTAGIGVVSAERNRTRAIFSGSAILLLDPDTFQTFLTFWRDTINKGNDIVKADWVAYLGHPEYVVKLLDWSATPRGVLPAVRLLLEFIPDVKLDPTDTFPDPWPLV